MARIKNTKNFRNDINGLRAWAVIAVVLYHFGVPGFSGGFVGVDVFFVISGFLMTGIIVGGLEGSGNRSGFSIWQFYIARASRIVPALVVVCAVVVALGWFLLGPPDYDLLAKHAFSALGFFSNMVFWREAGYFDASSHDKWLLHTWSLSIEWQFYLLLPLFLVAMWKLRPGRTAITTMIAIGFVVSLSMSIFLSPFHPTAAFFLLPTRAWEMLSGGLVFMLAARIKLAQAPRSIIEAIGFALIIFAVLLFDPMTIWPGWRALFPVIGTVLVLTAAQQTSFWTANRAAQWLGSCSYSVYLWHWPVVVAVAYIDQESNPYFAAAGILASLILGYVSYELIEQRVRSGLSMLSMPKRTAAISFLIVLVTAPAVTVVAMNGIMGRLPAKIEAAFMEAKDKNPRLAECHVDGPAAVPSCTYGGDKLGVIVIGDSHSASIMRTVEKSLPASDLHVLDWSLSSCPTFWGVHSSAIPGYHCAEFLDWAVAQSKRLPNNVPILIMNRTSSYLFGPNEPDRHFEVVHPTIYFDAPNQPHDQKFFEEARENLIVAACKFAETHPVYLIRPIPEMKINVPKTTGRALILGKKREVSITMDEYRERNAFVWEAQDAASARCGVKILNPLPYICNERSCIGTKAGTPLFFDDNHLSEYGAGMLMPMFKKIFKKEDMTKIASATGSISSKGDIRAISRQP